MSSLTGDVAELVCSVRGKPTPEVHWRKAGERKQKAKLEMEKNNIGDADKVCSELQLLQNCFDPIPTESSDQATQAKSSSSWEGIADAKIQ